MKPEVKALAAEVAKKLNVSIEIDEHRVESAQVPFSISCETVSITAGDRKLVVKGYVFPKRNRTSAHSAESDAKSFVLTFLTVSSLESHFWREISRKFFVFTLPTPGGVTLENSQDAGPILELAPSKEWVN